MKRSFKGLVVLLASGGVALIACATDPGPGSGFGKVPGASDASVTPPIGPLGNGELGECAVDGTSCSSGAGICTAGICCDAAHACGSACCTSAQVCSVQKCVTPGASCTTDDECGAGNYCDLSLGIPSSATAGEDGADAGCFIAGVNGRCMPKPAICDSDAGSNSSAESSSCLEKCEYHPQNIPFAINTKPKYAWDGDNIMMTPIVVQLDDDDCDGKVTSHDIPEIVFTSFSDINYKNQGTLHSMTAVSGQLIDKWPGWNGAPAFPGAQLAGGDIDGQPGNEVVYCGDNGNIYAVHGADGSPDWTSSSPLACAQPAIADLDQNGVPEVIVEGGILDGSTGNVIATFNPPMVGSFAISDLDGDGYLDIISSNAAYRGVLPASMAANKPAGAAFANTGITRYDSTHSWFQSSPAIADLDKDGKPEVVAVYFEAHSIAVWDYDPSPTNAAHFKWIQPQVDINVKPELDPRRCAEMDPGSAGATTGGGPVTVADFNADGYPDVALAGGVGYAVFDGQKLMTLKNPERDPMLDPITGQHRATGAQFKIWTTPGSSGDFTSDCTSASTGSSLFDFEGDGHTEVLYSDEQYLRIYNGETGAELLKMCNTTGTLNENPIVADVENDGQADIVVVSNDYNTAIDCEGTTQHGLRVFGSKKGDWIRTRAVWNEHEYHITNVNDDGTIPAQEAPNWTVPEFNNFRQNKQLNAYLAPDASMELATVCAPSGVSAIVKNIGEAPLPSGLAVKIYAGSTTGSLLGTAKTTSALAPAQSTRLDFDLTWAPQDVLAGSTSIVGVIDVPATLHECRSDNNTVAINMACDQIK